MPPAGLPEHVRQTQYKPNARSGKALDKVNINPKHIIFMKKALSVLLLLLVAADMNAQLLWKISGNGLQSPSFIVGTYHLAPVSFKDSIPGLEAALKAAGQVYGEIEMAEMAKPENLQKVQNAMMLAGGQTLDKLYTADEMARVNKLLADVLGVDMTNPMVAGQLGRLTPAALVTQLTVMMYMKKSPGFNPNESFDGYFQQAAKAQDKPVGGLETLDFQIKTLYLGKPAERQKEELLCLADHKEAYEMMTDDLTKAYFAQDLKAIKEAMDEKLNNSCDATPEEEESLIYGRNENWVKLMPGIMGQKPTFFAVGAGHLPGERGVIELLRKAGYTVEPVGRAQQ